MYPKYVQIHLYPYSTQWKLIQHFQCDSINTRTMLAFSLCLSVNSHSNSEKADSNHWLSSYWFVHSRRTRVAGTIVNPRPCGKQLHQLEHKAYVQLLSPLVLQTPLISEVTKVRTSPTLPTPPPAHIPFSCIYILLCILEIPGLPDDFLNFAYIQVHAYRFILILK